MPVYLLLLTVGALLPPRAVPLATLATRTCRPAGWRLGRPTAAISSGPDAMLGRLQAMIETGASEDEILSMLGQEQVGAEECNQMLEKIQWLRDRGEMVDVEGLEEEVLDSVDLEDVDSTKDRSGSSRVIDVTDTTPTTATWPPAASDAPKSPTSGEQPWGRWRQSATSMQVQLWIDEGVKVRELSVEVVEGWLIARIDTSCEVLYEDGVWGGEEILDDNNGGQPPLLFGRFAQPVVGADLEWMIDEEADGRRLLSIELPKAAQEGASATADCVFDETLLVNGEPCLVPGLSQGFITMKAPRTC